MDWSAPLYRLYAHRLVKRLDRERLPNHIGVILDGHRRFARAEGLENYASSYRSGMAKLEELIGWCADSKIPVVTAWVLSTDNLLRPVEELEPYFAVLIELLERIPDQAVALDFGFRVIGSLDQLPVPLAAAESVPRNKSGPADSLSIWLSDTAAVRRSLTHVDLSSPSSPRPILTQCRSLRTSMLQEYRRTSTSAISPTRTWSCGRAGSPDSQGSSSGRPRMQSARSSIHTGRRSGAWTSSVRFATTRGRDRRFGR